MNLDDLRRHWTLDPEVAFLNHGSFGACPRVVLERQAELRVEIEREPVRFLGRELEHRLDEVRERLGAFLGAVPEDVAFVPNATTGVNAVLRSLLFEPGDEILVTDHEYNACANVVDHVCARSGAKRVNVHVPFPLASAQQVFDAVMAAVTPRTKLLLIDHVTSPSALVMPVDSLVPALRERGVETLIDGAHAPGQIALALDDLGAGYATGNAHKWLCTPKGAAYLWVRRDLQEGLRPTTISHGANDRRALNGVRSRFRVEFDWQGTIDPTPVLCIPASLDFLGGLFPGGFDELRARNHALALAGRDVVLEAVGGEPPAPDDMLGSMATIALPDADPVELKSAFDTLPLQGRLYDEHRVEVPLMQWPAPGKRALRISAQAYNTLDDCRRLADALRIELGTAR